MGFCTVSIALKMRQEMAFMLRKKPVCQGIMIFGELLHESPSVKLELHLWHVGVLLSSVDIRTSCTVFMGPWHVCSAAVSSLIMHPTDTCWHSWLLWLFLMMFVPFASPHRPSIWWIMCTVGLLWSRFDATSTVIVSDSPGYTQGCPSASFPVTTWIVWDQSVQWREIQSVLI